MCGIFGVVFRQRSVRPPADLLAESGRRLGHRGPDAQSVYAGEGVGLAHTRLSFLDVDSRANQPFWDATGRYALVFNGEIYNYRELREELTGRGVEFLTTSDTEVLLHGLIEFGPEAILPRLEGMFGLGFYDRANGSLVLARDRFGMKPLYVYQDDRRVIFSSEVKAIRPWVDPELDRFSISSYLLRFGGPTKGFTFYRDLKSVAPGNMVSVTGGGVVGTKAFFSLPDFWNAAAIERLQHTSAGDLVDLLDERLSLSVDRHMFADVPVGAFCSGGVDSSLLMAMAARKYNNLAIFHSNVKGRWSERHAAEALAGHLKLDLQAVDVEEQDFVDRLPRVMAHYEHPFTYHPNCTPLMMVAQLARDRGVKGLLSGEGSDELFLGYPWLGRKRLMDAYYRMGRAMRSLVHAVPAVGRLLWPDEGTGHRVVRDLLNRREIADDERRAREVADRLGPGVVSARNRWTMDYLNYHLRTLLHRNDSMGMAASIEARFPFLDHRVASLAINMPARYKLRFSPTVWEKAHPWVRDKWVVRQVADRYIPRELSRRIKIGFWTTVFQRLRVSPEYFEGSFVQELFEVTSDQWQEVHREADQDLLMRLLHLDVWGRICVREEAEEPCVSRLRAHTAISPE